MLCKTAEPAVGAANDRNALFLKSVERHQTRRPLLISSPLQTKEDVQQRIQQYMFLDKVRLESKACPVQANVEITVPVEVVCFLEHAHFNG